MGILSTVIDIAKQIKNLSDDEDEEIEKEVKERNTKKSIKTLPFEPLPEKQCNAARNQFVGPLSYGDKKKFVKALDNGKVEFCKVIVRKQEGYHYSSGGSYRDYKYLLVNTLDGEELREYIIMPLFDRIWTYADLDDEYDESYTPEEIEKLEKKRKAVRYAWILHYFFGKEEYYVALSKDYFNKIGEFMKELTFFVPCLRDDLK